MKRDDYHILQDRAAGFVSRMFAYIADLAVIAGIVGVGGGVAALVDSAIESMGFTPNIAMTVIYVWMIPVIVGAYFIMLWSLTGRTIGKWFMGLKVIGSDGTPPSLWRSIVRYFGYVVSAVVFWLGYVWVLVDDERQGWHDHLAGTHVVYDYARRRSGEIYDQYRTRTES
ncbi:MAG: RDD family protein [Acidimicrobiia bacterium]